MKTSDVYVEYEIGELLFTPQWSGDNRYSFYSTIFPTVLSSKEKQSSSTKPRYMADETRMIDFLIKIGCSIADIQDIFTMAKFHYGFNPNSPAVVNQSSDFISNIPHIRYKK